MEDPDINHEQIQAKLDALDNQTMGSQDLTYNDEYENKKKESSQLTDDSSKNQSSKPKKEKNEVLGKILYDSIMGINFKLMFYFFIMIILVFSDMFEKYVLVFFNGATENGKANGKGTLILAALATIGLGILEILIKNKIL